MDQCQPHENSWTACQSSQVVNWVKTKPGLAGNQIPFGGTRFGFTTVGVYDRSRIPSTIDTIQNQIWLHRKEFDFLLALVLTQLTTWDDWRAVQNFSWGWHWSTFKNIGF